MKIYIFDLEANGFLDQATKVHCGVFKELDSDGIYRFTPEEIHDMLSFMEECDVLIGHNCIGYDFPLLKKLYGFEYKGRKVDTMVMSRLLDPRRQSPPHCPNKRAPHSVEAWGYRVGRGKPEHDDWENYSPEMLHRCEEDTLIQELIYKELLKEAEGYNWRDAFLLTFRLFENLQKQEEYGWKVDKEYMEKCIDTLDRWVRRIDNAIQDKLPIIIEINETKAKDGTYNYVRKPFLKSGKYSKSVKDWYRNNNICIDSVIVVGPFSRITTRRADLDKRAEIIPFLLDQGWKPLEYNYSSTTGERTSPKLSKDDPFDGIEGRLGKLVVKRTQCKHRRSSIEGLLGLIREDGAIPSVINNLAVTGRATHRNIVNIPRSGSFFGKQMRKIFSSREGMVLVSTDSAGNQLRQLAARMEDDDYIKALVEGKESEGTDIHTLNQKRAGLPDRDTAKTFIYGFLFGAGNQKIGSIISGTAEDGRRLKEEFIRQLPALDGLLGKISQEWKETAKKRFNPKFNRMEHYDGIITGLDGRPIRVPSEHMLLVYLLQSDEAIHMAAAYNIAHKKIEREGLIYGKDYGFVAWYHDEFTIECKPEYAELIKKISEDSIKEAGDFYNIKCPHTGEGKIGKNWYEVH